MNKRWRNVGLYVLLVVVVIVVGTAFLDRPDPATAARTLRYSDFVESVQEDQVSRVLLSPDRGTAQIVETNGNRAEVNLAPDKDLLKMLTDHNVDIAVQPSRQPGAWQQAATSLIFPLLLLGGLFFTRVPSHHEVRSSRSPSQKLPHANAEVEDYGIVVQEQHHVAVSRTPQQVPHNHNLLHEPTMPAVCRLLNEAEAVPMASCIPLVHLASTREPHWCHAMPGVTSESSPRWYNPRLHKSDVPTQWIQCCAV